MTWSHYGERRFEDDYPLVEAPTLEHFNVVRCLGDRLKVLGSAAESDCADVMNSNTGQVSMHRLCDEAVR